MHRLNRRRVWPAILLALVAWPGPPSHGQRARVVADAERLSGIDRLVDEAAPSSPPPRR